MSNQSQHVLDIFKNRWNYEQLLYLQGFGLVALYLQIIITFQVTAKRFSGCVIFHKIKVKEKDIKIVKISNASIKKTGLQFCFQLIEGKKSKLVFFLNQICCLFEIHVVFSELTIREAFKTKIFLFIGLYFGIARHNIHIYKK